MKILVVDDEKPLANAIATKLSEEKYTVTTVYNGIEAKDELEKNIYDVVLLDILMPQMNGFELLEELKKQKIKTKIIITSNLNQHEDIERAKKLGAVEFLVKSNMSLQQISEIVGKYIN